MKHFYCILIAVCIYLNVAGQGGRTYGVGDKIPRFKIVQLLNAAPVYSTAAYKNKLIIFDMMRTTCGSCIKALPRLDSLQRRFVKQIQILLVSPEKPTRVKTFLQKHIDLKLPFVAGDEVIAAAFPHEYISHVVWAGPDGMVKAITGAEYVTAENIALVLNGVAVQWPVKKDRRGFDFTRPLLSGAEKGAMYTAILPYKAGVPKHNSMTADAAQEKSRRLLVNYNLIDLCLILSGKFLLPRSRVIIEALNKNRFVYDEATGAPETWKEKNFWCVEAVVPVEISQRAIDDYLLRALQFQFRFSVSWEKRVMPCMVLQSGSPPAVDSLFKQTKGLRLGKIVALLNGLGAMPVIDETKGTTYLNLEVMEGEVGDMELLKRLLAEKGIVVKEERREVEVMVLRDLDYRIEKD